jgi:hypothetical protein
VEKSLSAAKFDLSALVEDESKKNLSLGFVETSLKR